MNTISARIYDFLKQFPPFSMLTQEQLLSICEAVDVHYIEKGNYIFESNNVVKEQFYVVKDGAIGIYRAETNTLVDECDEGDIFGLRALMRKDYYKLNAKAIEESIVYSISASLFENYITTNPKASAFLMKSFVTNTKSAYIELKNTEQPPTKLQDFSEEQSANYSKNPITCEATTSIKAAAKLMTENQVGSIVITKNKNPLGIITDKDLRTKIATGIVSIEETVLKAMSSPVITFHENITVAEAHIAMLKHRITHLCITKDGTTNTELTGILSEHDIIVLKENNATALVKEIKRAKTPEYLQQIRQRAQHLLERYIEQQIPITFITKIISTINNSITKKIIDLAINNMPTPPPTTFAWLAIGSQGREEQLLLTDQDNALVFENVQNPQYENTKHYFLSLSKKINEGLNTVGFEFCPAGMMASNTKWCLSVSQWKNQFERWIKRPDEDNLMLCTIFFDFEYQYGNKNLVETMSLNIFDSIDSYEIFLNYLGLNALNNPPPLSFFRQFLVEQSGEHKDQFDIKARAMMPLVDAARLLILSKNIKAHNNTIMRFKKLVQIEPQNKDLYNECIEAFKILLRFRTEQGLANNDSGRFIDLKSLSKANRLELKRCFKAVKEVQELIQVRFKLSHFL